MQIFLLTSTTQQLQIIKTFYHKLLRYFTGALSHTPLNTLYLLADMPDIILTMKSHAAKYWYRMLTIPENNPLYHIINNKWYQIGKIYITKITTKLK